MKKGALFTTFCDYKSSGLGLAEQTNPLRARVPRGGGAHERKLGKEPRHISRVHRPLIGYVLYSGHRHDALVQPLSIPIANLH